MRLFSHPRFLAIYSGVLTLAVATALLTGFARVPGNATFDSIDVQRIRVVAPDGTVRMVIANHERMPGIVVRGKDYPHPNRARSDLAGILFYDAEGTESGGLTFGGQRGADGKPERAGHLSFDQYDQDEMMALNAVQDGDQRHTGLLIKDEPDWPLERLIVHMKARKDEPASAQARDAAAFLREHGPMHVGRAWLGRNDDASSSMELKDPVGRPRLIARVAADGTPSLLFLDEAGHVTSRWPEDAAKAKAPAAPKTR
ncbi:hypothetical protein [Frateuria terrea]|uniref:Uncharacterized protein n=1 Tax=Frateuria terrea TaxID=529704 RepID=A0A1H6VCX8_9GAMM|nr:hypothetical protein [Frateuria terrea]SEJ00844.1 hypothetical protein SAMN04487997_2180 [Frateuria terrea]SFP65372.1 hypothetical protein SAMN02927913_3050 [Frateuria terrea]